MPYSAVEDLLVGDTPLSARLNKEKYVDDAADEIDSIIGVLYQTPVPMGENSSVARHSQLLLKRINNFLATGRMILALDIGGEDTALHAYGLRLVTEALAALAQIARGDVLLEGAVKHVPDVALPTNAPTISNYDAASAVDAFYDRVTKPENFPTTYRDWAPGSNPTGNTA